MPRTREHVTTKCLRVMMAIVLTILVLSLIISTRVAAYANVTVSECFPGGPGPYNGKPEDKHKKGTDGKACGGDLQGSHGNFCEKGICTLGEAQYDAAELKLPTQLPIPWGDLVPLTEPYQTPLTNQPIADPFNLFRDPVEGEYPHEHIAPNTRSAAGIDSEDSKRPSMIIEQLYGYGASRTQIDPSLPEHVQKNLSSDSQFPNIGTYSYYLSPSFPMIDKSFSGSSESGGGESYHPSTISGEAPFSSFPTETSFHTTNEHGGAQNAQKTSIESAGSAVERNESPIEKTISAIENTIAKILQLYNKTVDSIGSFTDSSTEADAVISEPVTDIHSERIETSPHEAQPSPHTESRSNPLSYTRVDQTQSAEESSTDSRTAAKELVKNSDSLSRELNDYYSKIQVKGAADLSEPDVRQQLHNLNVTIADLQGRLDRNNTDYSRVVDQLNSANHELLRLSGTVAISNSSPEPQSGQSSASPESTQSLDILNQLKSVGTILNDVEAKLENSTNAHQTTGEKFTGWFTSITDGIRGGIGSFTNWNMLASEWLVNGFIRFAELIFPSLR